jgi:hypothetical protein
MEGSGIGAKGLHQIAGPRLSNELKESYKTPYAAKASTANLSRPVFQPPAYEKRRFLRVG